MTTTLEDLQPQTTVRGILPDAPVTVVRAQWFGSNALELTYKTPEGRVASVLLYRENEPDIEVVERGRPWSFDGGITVPPGLRGASHPSGAPL